MNDFAMVPRLAIRRFKDLTAGEQALYLELCLHRCCDQDDENFGLAVVSRADLAVNLEMVKEYVSQLVSGLVSKGWIKKQGWKIRLIMGFFPVEKSENSDMLESKKVSTFLTNKKRKVVKKSDSGDFTPVEITGVTPATPVETTGLYNHEEINQREHKKSLAKPESDHGFLMRTLYEKTGPIPDGKAQGAAVKWLLDEGKFARDDCVACLDSLLTQDWRTARISWLTVRKEIGTYLAKREIIAEKVNEDGVPRRSKAEQWLNQQRNGGRTTANGD